jgi:small neutral amino acid transporter SnatA (MarC family)
LVELAVLGFVLLVDYVVFSGANQVSDKLQEDRMVVIEKVFGSLIAAIAVQLVLDGPATTEVIGPITH